MIDHEWTDHELATWARAHTRGVILGDVAIAVLRIMRERDLARRLLEKKAKEPNK